MSIIIKNLYHIYSAHTPFEKTALQNVSLEIQKGEFVGLIGHTGSGKSTLIQHINGLLKPTQGVIEIHGHELHSDKTKIKGIRQQIGLVFQYPEHQLFEMTVYKDVAFGPTNMNLPELEVDRRVRESLKMVGIDESFYDASPFELSGGQKRRVAIAGVLAMEPDVLILDEPTAGLDPKGRDEILHKIAHLQATLGITVVLVSHSMEDIAKFVKRLIVMDKGQIRFDDTPREVFKHHEVLEEMGLAAPESSYLVKALIEKGFDIPTDLITIDEIVAHLTPILLKVGESCD